ncbi:MAG: ROK family protein [Dehalococcoidia bacterium]
MDEASNLALAVDLGGTRTRCALVDPGGRMVEQAAQDTQAWLGQQAAQERLEACLHRLMARAGERPIAGIGVAAAGPVESATGALHNPPNLPGWDGVALKPPWEEQFHLPVWVDNDANLAALGEHRYGAGQGISDLVYLAVGTGIGAGVILDGRLVTGSRGMAGELGHMTIDLHGPRCACGNVGCLEALASGTAIARMAQERVAAGEQTLALALAGNDPQRITGELVTQAAEQGDRVAREITEQAAQALGTGIVNILHIFNPALVIVGGGVGRAWHFLEPGIHQVVQRYAMRHSRDSLAILPSALQDDAGLLGAASLVWARPR